jgi:hypothetical protein
LEFPDRVGLFRRAVVNRYDDVGEDIGVAYNHDSPRARVGFTVFVSRPVPLGTGASASLDQQFELEKQTIHTYHSGATEVWAQDVWILHGQDSLRGRAAEFRYAIQAAQAEQVVSQLFLFELTGWRLKYRLTFPARQQLDARPLADSLLQIAPWGGTSR